MQIRGRALMQSVAEPLGYRNSPLTVLLLLALIVMGL